MPAPRNRPKRDNFNSVALLPFQLRQEDFEIAMQDVYDLFFDVNTGLLEKGLERLDDFLRPAIMSGLLSNPLTAHLPKHSCALTESEASATLSHGKGLRRSDQRSDGPSATTEAGARGLPP
jgi:hypothetical protein